VIDDGSIPGGRIGHEGGIRFGHTQGNRVITGLD
jgi:hypothetical protein